MAGKYGLVGCICEEFLSPVCEYFCIDFLEAELDDKIGVVRLLERIAHPNQIPVSLQHLSGKKRFLIILRRKAGIFNKMLCFFF